MKIVDVVKNSLVFRVYEQYDAITARIMDNRLTDGLNGHECQKCGKCCSNFFLVSLSEFYTIAYESITQLPKEKLDNIIAIAQTSTQSFSLRYPEEYQAFIDPNNEITDLFSFEGLDSDGYSEMCPLLSALKECSTYLSRPLACRIFNEIPELPICELIKETGYSTQTKGEAKCSILYQEMIGKYSNDISYMRVIFPKNDGSNIGIERFQFFQSKPLFMWISMYLESILAGKDKLFELALTANRNEFARIYNIAHPNLMKEQLINV